MSMERPSNYNGVLVERSKDFVATVTINRPQAMNAFDRDMCVAFQHLWRDLSADDAVHAIVLRAAEGRAFSAGKDVRKNEDLSGSDNLFGKSDPGEMLGPKHNNCWKPVIAAVHGMCAGGAFYWINESDIVICAEDAEFFDPHVTYGMVAVQEPIGLMSRIAFGEVMRMALLGNDERISAATALRIGLVSEVVARDSLWGRAHELASKVASKPTVAVQGTVRAMWDALDMGRAVALKTGVKYSLLGNSLGKSEVDRDKIMAEAKKFEVR